MAVVYLATFNSDSEGNDCQSHRLQFLANFSSVTRCLENVVNGIIGVKVGHDGIRGCQHARHASTRFLPRGCVPIVVRPLARIHRSSRCRGQLMAEPRLRATERDRRDAWAPA